jgi:uncharacterized phiE125 gp8 family phage protein
MPLYLITAPNRDVVSLEDAKAHLRVDHDDDDDLIQQLIDAATARVDGRDGVLNRALVDQTWEYKFDGFPCGTDIAVPLPPLIEVESVKYVDATGIEQTFSSSSYRVSGVGASQGGAVSLVSTASWPVVATQWLQPVTVRFRAGYVDTSHTPAVGAVPAPIVAAIKLIVGHLYANRETVVVGAAAVEVPQSADWLLQRYIVHA